MQFALDRQQTKIASYNPRAEKHGDENVPAGDLKLDVTCHSSILDVFDKGLRKTLYRKPGPGEQPELPLGNSDGLTALKLPHLGPLKWDEDFPGYSLTITPGMGLTEPLRITDVELSKFVIEPMDGGSVRIVLSASFHPDAALSGALCALIQETVEVSLTPPSKDDVQQDLERAA